MQGLQIILLKLNKQHNSLSRLGATLPIPFSTLEAQSLHNKELKKKKKLFLCRNQMLPQHHGLDYLQTFTFEVFLLWLFSPFCPYPEAGTFP